MLAVNLRFARCRCSCWHRILSLLLNSEEPVRGQHGPRGELHVNLGRRDLGGLVVRPAATPDDASVGLRYAAANMIETSAGEKSPSHILISTQ